MYMYMSHKPLVILDDDEQGACTCCLWPWYLMQAMYRSHFPVFMVCVHIIVQYPPSLSSRIIAFICNIITPPKIIMHMYYKYVHVGDSSLAQDVNYMTAFISATT